MKTTRDILRSIWRNLDRIALALLLSILAVSLAMQLARHLEVSALIIGVDDIELGGEKQTLMPTPEGAVYLVEADPGRYWQEHYGTGNWQRKAEDYEKRHEVPPPTVSPKSMSPELKKHLDQFGEGSLFDPPVFVKAIGREKNLLGYWTHRSFEEPFRVQDPALSEEEEEKQIWDPPPPPPPPGKKPIPELGQWLRWKQPCEPIRSNLNFALGTVIRNDPNNKLKWDATFKIHRGRRSQTRILRIGERIPGTDYVVRDITSRTVERDVRGLKLRRREFEVAVSHRDGKGKPITLKKGQRIIDPRDKGFYEIIFLPEPERVHKLREGETLAVSFKGKKAEYRLVIKDGVPRMAPLSSKGETKDLPAEQENDFTTWEKDWDKPEVPKLVPIPPPPMGM